MGRLSGKDMGPEERMGMAGLSTERVAPNGYRKVRQLVVGVGEW